MGRRGKEGVGERGDIYGWVGIGVGKTRIKTWPRRALVGGGVRTREDGRGRGCGWQM